MITCARAVLLSLWVLAAESALAANSLVPHRCLPNMSCVTDSLPYSPIPLRVNFEAPVPQICVEDVLGELDLSGVAICEGFVASDFGTARQRAMAYVNLGHAYRFTKDRFIQSEFAVAAWDKAIDEDPTFSEPYILKGDVAAEGESRHLALPFYEKARMLDPTNWRAFMGAARVHAATGQLDLALDWAQKAVEIARDVGVAHQFHGNILMKAGRFEAALAEYLKATDNYDRTKRRLPGIMQEPEPWSAVAQAHLRLGHPLQAAAAISHQIDGRIDQAITPDDLIERGEFLEKGGRAEEAAADYDRAVNLFGPGYAKADEYRARAAMIRAVSGDGHTAKIAFLDLLKAGRLQSILRIQVFLRNKGFNEVAITGKNSPQLQKALEHCLDDKDCLEELGQPI